MAADGTAGEVGADVGHFDDDDEDEDEVAALGITPFDEELGEEVEKECAVDNAEKRACRGFPCAFFADVEELPEEAGGEDEVQEHGFEGTADVDSIGF